MKYLNFMMLLLLLSACSGENGVDGENGADGADGFSIGLKSIDMGNGCNQLQFFKDLNNNGIMDSNESLVTSFEVCNAAVPTIAMISNDDESCPNGGRVFTFFTDNNNNGVLDTNEEIIGSDTICFGTDGADGADGTDGTDGADGTDGTDGADGTDGLDGDVYSLFITQATTDNCTNGGFIISIFKDVNRNGEYNSETESILSETVICYPDRNSIDIPNFVEQGHTYSLLGVWRSYSALGTPIPEENRFNIYFYPDPLNPNKLIDSRSNQTGWVEFPMGSTPIGWSNTIQASPRRDELSVNHRAIEGVSIGELQTYSNQDKIIYNIGDSDTYTKNVTISIPVGVDAEIWPSGLRSIVFYKIQ